MDDRADEEKECKQHEPIQGVYELRLAEGGVRLRDETFEAWCWECDRKVQWGLDQADSLVQCPIGWCAVVKFRG